MTAPAAEGTAAASASAARTGTDPEAAFSTAGVRSNLKARSVRSGVINLGSRGVQVALGIVGTVVLARLLTPADFGIYAMVATLMVFVGNFRDFGLPLATAHRESISHHEYSILFWLYQGLNLLTALFMLLMGPVLAWFYSQPALTAMTAAMALGVFVLGLTTQQESLLKRQMRFAALTLVDVGGTVLGVAVAIAAALLGTGYWALVLQFMTMCIFRAAGTWMICGWRPSRLKRGGPSAAPGLWKLLAYGKDVTAARLVSEVGRNLDRVLVGYFAGAQALGLYHQAFQWSHLPAKQIYSPLTSVAVSGLSRVQDEPKVYRACFRRGVLPAFAVSLPLLAFLFAEADRVIGLLLGPQWLDAVPLFRILCIAAFVGKLGTVTKWVYFSSGETRRQFHWTLISTPVLIAAVSLGSLWGVHGVAIGFTAAICLLTWPGVWFCVRRSHLRARDFLSVFWRPAAASLMAAGVVMGAEGVLVPASHPLIVLPAQLALFTVSYALAWLILPGGLSAVRDMLRLTEALPWKRRAAAAASAVQVK